MIKFHVVSQVTFGSTFVIAQLASKWLFTGMNSVVGLQSALSGKTLIAIRAREWFFSSVCYKVKSQN